MADLKTLIARRAVAVVTGAGFSKLLSGDAIATWPGFLDHALDHCRFLELDLSGEWFRSARERIASGDAAAMVVAYGEIAAKLPPGDKERLFDALGHLAIKNASPAHALAAWQCPIITTNFDNLIERITGIESVTWNRMGRAQEVLSGAKDGVLHVHGIFDDPDTIVMTPDSYRALLNDQQRQALLHGLKTVKALVFIGCGGTFADPNFSSLFAWSREFLPGTSLRVYRLARAQELAALRREHPDSDRVALISYGESYEDLTPFLWSLAPKKTVSWPIPTGLMILALAGISFYALHSPSFRIQGVVLLGERPAGESTVLIPGHGSEQVTDPNGYFTYDCRPGQAVHTVEVRLGGKPFHFRLPGPVTTSQYLELHLETETTTIRSPR